MSQSGSAPRLTPVQWLICIISTIGFAFDIYVLLVAPIIMQPALTELGHLKPGTPEFNNWVSYMFYVPAVAGGLFGMIGGYLTDILGRRRVLTFSILLYAVATMASGYSTSLEMLLFFRCLTFVGVCVEFVAAVAWLAELFSDPGQREKVLGMTQAFSSIGGILMAAAYSLIVTYGDSFPAVFGGHAPWRYLLISGVIPAVPLILIRPFLPESPVWKEKKDKGQLKRPSFGEIFEPKYRRTTIVSTIIFACSYGAAFGAIQQAPRIVPGIQQVMDAVKLAPTPPAKAKVQQQAVSNVNSWQETGGLIGRIVLAILAMYVASRRNLLRIFQVPGLFIVPAVFLWAAASDLAMFKWGLALAAFCTVAQFSFWGNYLPLVYPLHLRGTGEGFAANIGGRMIGTGFAAVTAQLSNIMPGATPPAKLAYASAAVALFVYVVGFACSFALPEPKAETMAEN
ncbi:MAG: MFS transporter [Bryobacteraceae bacterium]